MNYQDYKNGISERLDSAAEDFFTVGYYLRKISEDVLFLEDGYKDIWEFAKGEFNLSKSSASRFMAINARFSIDGGERMDTKYIGMGVSKLQEMLGLPDEELEKVTKETTVRELRAIKAALKPDPLSFYDLPKTVRPEGSLLTTPGCGDGKHSCFSCCRECKIRQESRHCVKAPLGNPSPCTRIENENWKANIAFSLYKDECQLLHPELAPVREGDKEPDPCCLYCKNKGICYCACDVARQAYKDEVKARQAEEQKKQRELEAEKPEPTQEEIKALYKRWRIEGVVDITAAALKAKYNYSGGNGNGLEDYNCTSRGVRINYKRELTWARIAKEFKEIRQNADKTEKECLVDFYKEIYPSTRTTIKNRNAAEITKTFKTEYGSMYENGKGFSCYPDKVVLDPAGTKRQITWGKLTTKLLALLDEEPGLETKALAADAPKVIDAEFVEIEDEPESDPEPKAEQTPVVEAPDGQIPAEIDEIEEVTDESEEDQQEANVEPQRDPQSYDISDVSSLLIDHQHDLKNYIEADLPEKHDSDGADPRRRPGAFGKDNEGNDGGGRMNELMREFDYAMELLQCSFELMNNTELLELKKRVVLEGRAKLLFEKETRRRNFEVCRAQPEELKEETWIVTYIYSPLGKNPADSNWWGFGSVALKAKSAAEAYEEYPDKIKNPEWTSADGSVTYRGPWQLSALSIFSIGDNPVLPMPDAIRHEKKEGDAQ